MKNGVHSCSEMNIMDDLGWIMELWGEKNDRSSILCFLRFFVAVMEESKIVMD